MSIAECIYAVIIGGKWESLPGMNFALSNGMHLSLGADPLKFCRLLMKNLGILEVGTYEAVGDSRRGDVDKPLTPI